jgi:hypothetical protein
MVGTIVRIVATGSYSAETENAIGVTFRIADGNTLKLGDQVEIDLPRVVTEKSILRLRDGVVVKIDLRESDLHDLRLPIHHGGTRQPSVARLTEGSWNR